MFFFMKKIMDNDNDRIAFATHCNNTDKLDVTFQVQEIGVADAFGERMGRPYLSVTSPMKLGIILLQC